MDIKNDDGVVTITMSEKDAKDFAIVVRAAQDADVTDGDAEMLGVSDEELANGLSIIERLEEEFELMGFYGVVPDHNDDPDDEGE